MGEHALMITKGDLAVVMILMFIAGLLVSHIIMNIKRVLHLNDKPLDVEPSMGTLATRISSLELKLFRLRIAVKRALSLTHPDISEMQAILRRALDGE